MTNNYKDFHIACKCGFIEHLFIIRIWDDRDMKLIPNDAVSMEMCISVNNSDNILKRFWNAIKYIFKSSEINLTSIIINNDDVKKIAQAIEEYEVMFNEYEKITKNVKIGSFL